MDKKKKYAIRKLTVGAVSIAVGLSLVASNIKTEAQEPKGLETKYNKEDGYIGETKDDSILGVLYKKEGRIFLKAKALHDVENVSVEIYDQKGNKYLSKIAKLKAEEEEEIEVKKEGKRVLPNTALVRKTLAFEAQTGEDSYKVRISYDVEEDIQAASPEVPASPGAESRPAENTGTESQPDTGAATSPGTGTESQPDTGAATSPAAPAGTGAEPAGTGASPGTGGNMAESEEAAPASPEAPAGNPGAMAEAEPESGTVVRTQPGNEEGMAEASPTAPESPAENTVNHEMPGTGGEMPATSPGTGTESQPMADTGAEPAGTGGDMAAASPEVPAENTGTESQPMADTGAETGPAGRGEVAPAGPESSPEAEANPGTAGAEAGTAASPGAESRPEAGAMPGNDASPEAPAGSGETAPAGNPGAMAESQPDTGAEAAPEPAGSGETAPEASPAAPAGSGQPESSLEAEASPENGGAMAESEPESGTVVRTQPGNNEGMAEASPGVEERPEAGSMPGDEASSGQPTAPAENNGEMPAASPENGGAMAESGEPAGTGAEAGTVVRTQPGNDASPETQPMADTGTEPSPAAEERPEAGSMPGTGGDMPATSPAAPEAPAENTGAEPAGTGAEAGTVVRTQPGNNEGMAEASPGAEERPEAGSMPGTGGDMPAASPAENNGAMGENTAEANPGTGAEPSPVAPAGNPGAMAGAEPESGTVGSGQPGAEGMAEASPTAPASPAAPAGSGQPESRPEAEANPGTAGTEASPGAGSMPGNDASPASQPMVDTGAETAPAENTETEDMEEEAPEPEPTEKLYVNTSAESNGDGSKENPYNDLMDAIEAANDGEAVVLLGDVNLSTSMNNSTLTTSKSITIDGQGYTISGRDLSYSFKGDKTVLKNITLSSTQDGSTPQYIYTNHSSVTFDNVTTRPMGTQNQDAFILVVGSDSSDVATEKDVTVIFKNSPAPTEHVQGRDGKSYTGTAFKKIITANMNKNTSRKTKLKLDAHTRIDTSSSNPMGISLSSGNHMNTGEVSITLEGNSDINYIDASNASNSSLILKNRNGNKKLDIKNKINNITLNNSSVTFSNNVKDIDTLEMKNANDSVQVASSTNMNIGNIKSNGGKIKLGLNSSINVKNNISGNLNLSINPQKFEITDESNERIYLTVGSGNLDEVNASIEFNEKSGDASNYKLKKESNKLKLVRKNQANIAMKDEALAAPTASFTEPEEEDGILNVFFDINGEGITSRKLIIKKASDDSTFKNITLGNMDFSYMLSDLTSGEKYKLKLEIEYDLKDGKGSQTLEVEYDKEVSV
ncbi:YSIRK-type signal peptide-containing protein [Gemella sp. zg-1178]|uniref:YSIRK-type signal peptide-containing protein n=1 Tax=Gemella sp. zg-1178 TaxID=2840372 RepID=UPI001C05D364|nr:YSIRK-type signal peptide-containing protein [Gemella sp. zg-1178]MBU0279254.1 YSIRK-type signal peptide-containing protein [Gemella sp. zg-1178]